MVDADICETWLPLVSRDRTGEGAGLHQESRVHPRVFPLWSVREYSHPCTSVLIARQALCVVS